MWGNPAKRSPGRAGGVFGAVALVVVALVVLRPSAADASTIVTTQVFGYNGAVQSFTVPAFTTQLVITTNGASGAAGGSVSGAGSGGSGGIGESITTTIAVGGNSPVQVGDQLQIWAGGAGGSGQLSDFAGGPGGAGSELGGGGGAGGGGSAVFDQTSSTWINVAAGGGGGGGGGGVYGGGGPGGNWLSSGVAGGGTNGGSSGSVPAPCSGVDLSVSNGGGGGSAGTATDAGGGGGGGGGCPGASGGGGGGAGGGGGGGGAGAAGYVNPAFSNYSINGAPSGNGSVTITYTQTYPVAPSITSGASTSFFVGLPSSFTVTATGQPTPTLTEIGTLPGGLSFTDNGNGTATLAGAPVGGSGGVYRVTVVANNSGGSAFQTLTITVDEPAGLSGPSSATFTVGQPGSFTVTATGYPVPSMSEVGSLPSGLSFTDNGNGTATISGTPAPGTGGVYGIGVGASNGEGVPQAVNFTIVVDEGPAITSSSSATFTVGQPGSVTVTTRGYPVPSITQIGTLPAGLSFTDNGNGTATVSGTPAPGTGGVSSVTLVAVNPMGTTLANLAVTVDQAPAITSPSSATFTVGQPGSFTVTATGYPAPTLREVGPLPSGLTFTDNGNGTATISGTPKAVTAAPASIEVEATNASGMATQQVALTVTTSTLWFDTASGAVIGVGSSPSYGSMANRPLNAPMVGMAATPDGGGYWLVGADGGVFAFGDAGFFGSMGGTKLAAPVVGMAATPDGGGYWLVAADGGVFSFGDAGFFGSMSGTRLNAPMVGMAATPGGGGYWLVAADGGVFSFGNAPFDGSTGAIQLESPVVTLVPTVDGQGYVIATRNGQIIDFGNATVVPLGVYALMAPVVGGASP